MAETNTTHNDNKSAVENIQDKIVEIASYVKGKFVGEAYLWPDWDAGKLGKPPTIVMPSAQEPNDVVEFNKVLSNLSKMANIDSADELRNQLKAISGMPINIKDLTGNEDANMPPIGTPIVGAEKKNVGNSPEMSFNPNVWGRYPIEDSATEYGIASPEQMMIHELGHYVEIQKIADKLKQANAQSNVPVSADKNDNIAYQHAVDEPHIIKDYENPAMASVDPNFKKRDPNRYSDAKILLENKNGYPDVTEQDRAALIHSMEMSGRDVPEQLNAPVTPKNSSSKVEENQGTNLIATNVILNLYLSQLTKDEGMTTSNLASLQRLTNDIVSANAENGTLPTIEVKEKSLQHDLGHELT